MCSSPAHGFPPNGSGRTGCNRAAFGRRKISSAARGRFPPASARLRRAAVRFAETRTDSAVIFSTACDQMRRGFDARNSSRTATAHFCSTCRQRADAGGRSNFPRRTGTAGTISSGEWRPGSIAQRTAAGNVAIRRDAKTVARISAGQFTARVCRGHRAISLGRNFFAAATGRAGKPSSTCHRRRAISRIALEIAGRNRSWPADVSC